MEVTNENFSKAFEILSAEIESADFIAIDGEFSGLSTIKQWGSGYETIEEKYEKIRVGSSKMLLIQYGISLFTWKEDMNRYEAMPFTFYIFPRPYKKYGNDVKFSSQSSSIDFLAHQGFDFNKLFHKGISFMSRFNEEKAKEAIEKEMAFYMEKEQHHQQNLTKPADKSGESKVFIPKDQREFIDDVVKKMADFMNDGEPQSIDLSPCSPFQRKLIYEKLEELYPLGLYLEAATNESNQKFIRGHKTMAGYKKNLEEKYQKEMELLEEAIGFTKTMRLISKSKKPIIGHNMMLDLFLSITNFFGEPPINLRDFKEVIVNLFSVVIDTKYIASTPPLQVIVSGTSLETLIENIDEERLPKVDVVISEKLKEEKEYTNKYHQAGYDAYSTGLIFLSMAKCLHSLKGQPSEHINLSSNLLDCYINRVFLMGLRDINCVDIAKEDILPARRNVFYVRFPVTWKANDIKELFSPYSALDYPINWINDESAFVTISNMSFYEDIYQNIVIRREKERTCYVLPYYYYINNLDPKERRSISNDNEENPAKRRRVDSDVEEGEIDSDEDKEATI